MVGETMAPQFKLPKLSQLTQILAAPETYFENMIKSSLNIEAPPGPMSLILNIQKSLEGGAEESSTGSSVGLRIPTLQEVLASFPVLPAVEVEAEKAEEVPLEEREVAVKKKEEEILVF